MSFALSRGVWADYILLNIYGTVWSFRKEEEYALYCLFWLRRCKSSLGACLELNLLKISYKYFFVSDKYLTLILFVFVEERAEVLKYEAL